MENLESRRTIRGESLPQNPRPETGAEFLTSLLKPLAPSV
jgi:hypothetical protein